MRNDMQLDIDRERYPRLADDFVTARDRCRRSDEPSMQCVAYDPARLPAPAETAVEIKYDGLDLSWVSGEALTRGLASMACTAHLSASFHALERAYGCKMMFHGQYMHKGGLECAISAWQSGAAEGYAVIFDAVPLLAWHGHEMSPPLKVRRELLESAMSLVQTDDFQISRYAVGFSQEAVELAAQAAWDEGLEGIVVKDIHAPYVRGESSYWQKVKRRETLDLPIVDVVQGQGPWLHEIVCREDDKLVRVYPGFTDDQRANLWRDHVSGALNLIGLYAEIKFTGRSRAGRVCSPVFRRIRTDKARAA